MIETIIDGYFTENQCKKIKEKMQGKTYFNFDIVWSNEHSNCKIIVRSDIANASAETLKEMFIYACICELGM